MASNLICHEVKENKSKRIVNTKTKTNLKQKQILKDKEYTVIIDDDSSQKYQCTRCEKKFKTRMLMFNHHYRTHKEIKL